MNTIDMEGLCPSPEPQFLYVDLFKGEDGRLAPWHTWDPNSDITTQVYLPTVMGKLMGLKMSIKEFQGKENFKLDIRVQSGNRTWIIRSGVETVFTRGVLLGLTGVEDLSRPVKIYAQPADTTVLGSVYNENNYRYVVQWDDQAKLFPIIQDLQVALHLPKQEMSVIREEFEQRKRRD